MANGQEQGIPLRTRVCVSAPRRPMLQPDPEEETKLARQQVNVRTTLGPQA